MPRPEEIELRLLKLDPLNPRLPVDLQPRRPRDLLRNLAATYSLEELGESITRYGYFQEEPMLVVEDKDEPGTFIVIEGNRRLAALKLLTDARARADVARPKWDEWAEQVSGRDLSRVPAFVYNDRSELLGYLGFRHVTGIIKWSAEAKARFIVKLVNDYGKDFTEVARAIGSRADAVRRQYVAYSALQQASSQGIDIARAENHFGVWYRALQAPAIREYAGIDGWVNPIQPGRPVLTKNPEVFDETLVWLFGGGDDGDSPPPVIRDSRQLSLLGKVLRDATALSVLKSEGQLSAAADVLEADRSGIIGTLNSALRYLRLAIGDADKFVGDRETLEVAQQAYERAVRLIEVLRATSSTDEPSPRPSGESRSPER